MKNKGYQVNLLSAGVFLLSACLFIYVAVLQDSIVYRCMSGVAAFFSLVSSGCFFKAYLLKKQSTNIDLGK